MVFHMTLSSKDEQKVMVPTWRQLVTQGKMVDCVKYVNRIWMPGDYKQLTLETDEFRLGIDTRTEFGTSAVIWVTDAIDNNKPIKIKTWLDVDQKWYWEVNTDDDYEQEYRWFASDSGCEAKGKMKAVVPQSANPRSKRK